MISGLRVVDALRNMQVFTIGQMILTNKAYFGDVNFAQFIGNSGQEMQFSRNATIFDIGRRVQNQRQAPMSIFNVRWEDSIDTIPTNISLNPLQFDS